MYFFVWIVGLWANGSEGLFCVRCEKVAVQSASWMKMTTSAIMMVGLHIASHTHKIGMGGVSPHPVTTKVGEVVCVSVQPLLTAQAMPEIKIRDAIPKQEEKDGVLSFRVVENDGTAENLKALIILKDIFSKQLPKMPVEYIARLVFDRNHKALALVKK